MQSKRLVASLLVTAAVGGAAAGCSAEGTAPEGGSTGGSLGDSGGGGPVGGYVGAGGSSVEGSGGSSVSTGGGTGLGGGAGIDTGGSSSGGGGNDYGGTGGGSAGGIGTGGIGTGGIGTGGIGTGGNPAGGTSAGGSSAGGSPPAGGGTGGGTRYVADPCPTTGEVLDCADDCGGSDPACGALPCGINSPFYWGSAASTYTIRTTPASTACGCGDENPNFRHVTFGDGSTEATLRITINQPWSLYEKRYDAPLTGRPWSACDDQPPAAERSQCIVSPPVPRDGFRLIAAITEYVGAPPMNMTIETVAPGATCP